MTHVAPGPARAAIALVAAGLVAAACGPNHDADRASPVAADTARGVVTITGAEPITWVTLQTERGPVTLEGPAADALRAADGVEVWVAGRREGEGALEVQAFRVRAVDGIPAVDGVLEVDGDAAVLVTAAGERVRFSPAPSALRAWAGHRVWVAGPAGGEPQSWGVLRDR